MIHTNLLTEPRESLRNQPISSASLLYAQGFAANGLRFLPRFSVKWQDFHNVIQAAIEVYRNSGRSGSYLIYSLAASSSTSREAKRKDGPNARKKYPQLDLAFGPSLRSFATQRADLLPTLEPLPIDAWSRTARISGAGKVLERTLLFSAQ